jgi:hypothetical protein
MATGLPMTRISTVPQKHFPLCSSRLDIESSFPAASATFDRVGCGLAAVEYALV